MARRNSPFSLCAAIGAAMASLSAYADVPAQRHGAVEGPAAPTVEAGLTLTFQSASDSRVREEAAASVDFLAGVPLGAGVLTLYVEGATSPRDRGVSAFVPDANADVGSALDRDDAGRFQVSELRYDFNVGTAQLFAGLLNPSGFLDSSAVANDETSQFLNASLVNNPTIELPDYTLGLALHRDAQARGAGFTALLTSSHGLGDNPDRSYRQLFDVDGEGKGLFLAGELYWELGDFTPRLGIWTHTADHERLNGGAGNESNHGAYGMLDGVSGPVQWNLRLGAADARVSEAAWFVGAAMERPFGAAGVGVGLTHTAVSSDARDGAPGALGDTTQAELYGRFNLGARWQLTPSLQYVRNPGFDRTGDVVDRELWVAGARLSAAF